MRLNGRSNRRFMSMWVMIVTFEYGSVFFGCVQRGVCMRTKKMKKMNKAGKSYFKGRASTSSLYSIVFVSRFLWKWENNHSELRIIKNEAISSFVCIQREKKYWCSEKVCEREREGRKKTNHVHIEKLNFPRRYLRCELHFAAEVNSHSSVSVDLAMWKMLRKLSSHLHWTPAHTLTLVSR